MTTIVSISGVHGVGKTTAIRHLAHSLESVYVMPELDYLPFHPLGPANQRQSEEFFVERARARKKVLDALLCCDLKYIILDRDFIDIQVYAEYFGEWEIARHASHEEPSANLQVILYNNNLEEVMSRIHARNREVLAEWREDDLEYARAIQDKFIHLNGEYCWTSTSFSPGVVAKNIAEWMRECF